MPRRQDAPLGGERVMLVHVGEGGSAAAARPRVLDSFVLPDPRTGNAQGVMLAGNAQQLLEVQQFKQMYSAWFGSDQLTADGSLYLCSPLDVLFPLLPILEAARNKGSSGAGMFCAAEQILTEAAAQWPGAERLAQAAASADLGCVCDEKEAGGDTYYRLSDQKVLAWLLCKVEQARLALAYQLSGMDAASQSSYISAFLAEYLPDRWAAALATELGVSAAAADDAHAQPTPSHHPSSEHGGAPPEKKQKVDPKEAARRKAEETRQLTKAKQAAGTHKISAFFAPRSKAK